MRVPVSRSRDAEPIRREIVEFWRSQGGKHAMLADIADGVAPDPAPGGFEHNG